GDRWRARHAGLAADRPHLRRRLRASARSPALIRRPAGQFPRRRDESGRQGGAADQRARRRADPVRGHRRLRPARRGRAGDHPVLFPVNCYLVREDDGFTLVDTALAGSAPAIRAAARALGAPIRRIALTHAHGDHAGSLNELHAALPDAEVLVPAREARFLAGDLRLDPDEPQDKLRGWWLVRTTPPTRLLHPG